MKYRIRKNIDSHSHVQFYLEKYVKRFVFFGKYVWRNAKEYGDIAPPYIDDGFRTADEARLYLKYLTANMGKSQDRIVDIVEDV